MALEIVWRNPLLPRSVEHKVQQATSSHQVHTARRAFRGKVIQMKARKSVFGTITAVGIGMVLVMLTAINGEAQIAVHSPAPRVAARIPFDFWVGGAHLPAGDYTLNFMLETLVLFRNAAANAQEQVFLVPTGEPGGSGEGKLVFVEQNRQYYLQELWNTNGRSLVTWRTGASLDKNDARFEITLTQDGPDKMAAGR